MKLKHLIAALILTLATPAFAQVGEVRGKYKWESVRSGEVVMDMPSGPVIIDCKTWSWRKIGSPSSKTPIIKHHPAYDVCGGGL